ncbi:tRNA (mnm(5)s(2)U34)-methyltransferase [Streptococcus agalactiae]|uniref:tRNA (mnm(5)s(2)U34)-methyltransferase n=1 Tax=Streptococcus agalactiae TaxID=1311 RepID=UPI000332E5C9|nr:class I SAM-dependent methyltransferase [Streptococcus agalactiae]OTG47585.1 SAM-dependent methyltransferase [Streptococcus agalactiae]CCW40379.1 SAM-dependent methyltransferase, MraW methylase family [Streptococcus agalactiae ILRI005]
MIKRPIHLSHDFLAEVIDKEAITLDATMGNGNDTVFLAKSSKKVYAFDIQEEAIAKTKAKLTEQGISNVELILDGHENLEQYVHIPLRAAIFNLGYLPSADKTVITKPHTTIKAIKNVLDILEVGGRLSLMVYYGHDGGKSEKDAVIAFVEQLPQNNFATMLYQPLNQVNTPPFLIMVEKLQSYENEV